MSINERVSALRDQMKSAGVQAFIIPSDDPHKSEYVAERWAVREWISGFTGSAGTAVVTLDHAGIWTDSRYYLQADQELAQSEFELHKLNNQGADEFADWLGEELPSGSKVGINGLQFSPAQVASYKKIFNEKGIELDTNFDPINAIWPDRPQLPVTPVFEISTDFTGESRVSKLDRILEVIKAKNADVHLVATLDDICWILNLRGADVAFNPVFHAFLLIGVEGTTLFIDPVKVPKDIREKLSADGVDIVPYADVLNFLKALDDNTSILIDRSAINYLLYEAIAHCQVISTSLPSRHMKALKNWTEVGHIRNAMAKDGAALTRMYMWLEKTLKERAIPEAEIADKLAHFRSQQDGYVGESFSAIVGFKGNGAIIHYRPEYDKCADITGDGMLLVDSGGQYLDGTTDITRTIYLGDPDPEHKKAYTLVLKGHIALDKVRFPRGTKGVQLDILARQPLWSAGMNYGHGTGHGVGFFLNVHEPPQGVIPGLGQRGVTPFEEGMFTSNEPGFYKTDGYGIRIENLILAVADEKTEYGDFLKFESLTVFPIDTKLVDHSLITNEEIKWLNDYHKMVYDAIAPRLDHEEKSWLKEKCAPINREEA